MPIFRMPVTWEVCGEIKVDALNLEEAIKFYEYENLPTGEYIDGSLVLDHDVLEELNSEIIEIDKTKVKDLPLLFNKIITEEGKAYLEEKLKE